MGDFLCKEKLGQYDKPRGFFDVDNVDMDKFVDIFNGNSRILNWRYLPYIRPM